MKTRTLITGILIGGALLGAGYFIGSQFSPATFSSEATQTDSSRQTSSPDSAEPKPTVPTLDDANATKEFMSFASAGTFSFTGTVEDMGNNSLTVDVLLDGEGEATTSIELPISEDTMLFPGGLITTGYIPDEAKNHTLADFSEGEEVFVTAMVKEFQKTPQGHFFFHPAGLEVRSVESFSGNYEVGGVITAIDGNTITVQQEVSLPTTLESKDPFSDEEALQPKGMPEAKTYTITVADTTLLEQYNVTSSPENGETTAISLANLHVNMGVSIFTKQDPEKVSEVTADLIVVFPEPPAVAE